MTGKAHEVNEATKRTPVANRKFKDTVFRMLFSDKEALLSLYNAVNNSHYTDSCALEIVYSSSGFILHCGGIPEACG